MSLIACKKEHNALSEIDLIIYQTHTTGTIQLGQPITSSVRYYYGSCDGIKRLDITNSNNNTIAIKVKGNKPPAGTACADEVFSKDTTLSIPATSKGQYILKFYNRDELFKADTVQVN